MTTNLSEHGARTAGDQQLVQVPTAATHDDGATTAVYSPKTGVTTTPQAFTVPTDATMFVFSCTEDARYGDNATLDGSAATKGYKKYYVDSGDCRYPCAGMTTVYVAAESGTVDVDFTFEKVN